MNKRGVSVLVQRHFMLDKTRVFGDRKWLQCRKGTFPKKLAEDCDDPELFKTLAGFADRFPYKRQSQPIPKKKKS